MVENENNLPEDSDNDEMEFNPILFMHRHEMPADSQPFQIIRKLECKYGHKDEFRMLDYQKFIVVIFLNKTIARRAFTDKLELGQASMYPFTKLEVIHYGFGKKCISSHKAQMHDISITFHSLKKEDRVHSH